MNHFLQNNSRKYHPLMAIKAENLIQIGFRTFQTEFYFKLMITSYLLFEQLHVSTIQNKIQIKAQSTHNQICSTFLSIMRNYLPFLIILMVSYLFLEQFKDCLYILVFILESQLMQLSEKQKKIQKQETQKLRLAEQRKSVTPEEPQEQYFESEQSQEDVKSYQQQNITIKIQQQLNELVLNQEVLGGIKEEAVVYEYKTFDHNVDHKYIVLLMVMNARKLINVKQMSGLKQGYIDLYGKFSKVSVKTVDQKNAKAAILKISDYIDNLSILKLNIIGQAAKHLENFRKLKDYYSKLRVIIFGYSLKSSRQLHIGGQMKPSQLKMHTQTLKSLQINYVSMRQIRNTRSYKVIFDELLQMKEMKQALIKLNQISLSEVEVFNKLRIMRILFASTGKKQYAFSEYEDFIMKEIQNYYVITILLDIFPQYFEKLVCENINVKYIRQFKLKRSQLLIIGHKDNFLKNQKPIKQYLQKFNQNIIGIRFFYHIYPNIKHIQLNKQQYYFLNYPQVNPYSVNVYKNKFHKQNFDWQSIYDKLLN